MAFLSAFAFEEGRMLPRVRSWAQVVLCAGLGFITLLSDYYTLAGLVYFSAGYAAWYGLRLGEMSWRRPRPWLGLGALLLAGHLLSRLLSSLHVPDKAGLWWGGDLAGYLVPPLGNRWLATAGHQRALAQPPLPHARLGRERDVSGVRAAALALVLWWRRRRARRPSPRACRNPAVVGPGPAVFPADPARAALPGHRMSAPAHQPYALRAVSQQHPVPTRHVLLLSLLLPLATLIGLEGWLRAEAGGARWALAAGLTGLVLPSFSPGPSRSCGPRACPGPMRWPRRAPAHPSVSHSLRPARRLPAAVGGMDPAELFYQTRHQQALPGAYVSRVPAATFAAFAHEPVLRGLLLLQEPPRHAAPGPAFGGSTGRFSALLPACGLYHPARLPAGTGAHLAAGRAGPGPLHRAGSRRLRDFAAAVLLPSR